MLANPTLQLARRLRLVREDIYGKAGDAELAESLDLPCATWANYEAGVVIPGETILRFILLTGACPRWLMAGDGPPTYRVEKQ